MPNHHLYMPISKSDIIIIIIITWSVMSKKLLNPQIHIIS